MLVPPSGIGEFRFTETYFPTAPAGTIVAKEAPTRVLLIFASPAATAIFSTSTLPSANEGIAVNTTNPVFTLDWSTYGILVTVPWRVTAAISAPLTVIEMFYEPKGYLTDGRNTNSTIQTKGSS